MLSTLQQLALDSGKFLPPAEQALPEAVRTAGMQQPAGTLIHLPWAGGLFQQPDGYIPATAQEALLQTFL